MKRTHVPFPLRCRVTHRDRGICSICGRDCASLDDALLRLRLVWPELAHRWAALLGLRVYRTGIIKSAFDCDHVIPLAEGGDDSLSNLRTACHWCHQAITAEYVRRAA